MAVIASHTHRRILIRYFSMVSSLMHHPRLTVIIGTRIERGDHIAASAGSVTVRVLVS
jgi:hypothetical protein